MLDGKDRPRRIDDERPYGDFSPCWGACRAFAIAWASTPPTTSRKEGEGQGPMPYRRGVRRLSRKRPPKDTPIRRAAYDDVITG